MPISPKQKKRMKAIEYSQRWYEKNKEEQKIRQNKRYKENAEEYRKKSLEYYYEHRDDCIAKGKERRRKFRATPEGREYTHQEYIRRKDYHRNRALKANYGITLDDYNKMSAAQGGVCAICKQPDTHVNRWGHTENNLSVDHCHETGRVRGLLCKRCNQTIGHFSHSIEMLQSAIDYLKPYQ